MSGDMGKGIKCFSVHQMVEFSIVPFGKVRLV